MTFDGTIHLGDVLVAVSLCGTVLIGGIAFMVKWGRAIEKIDGTFNLVWSKIEGHEKRLDKLDERVDRRATVRVGE